jgi:hypothetical protein
VVHVEASVGARNLIGVFALLSLCACEGPRPEMREMRAEPDARDPSRQWVEVLVANAGSGDGEARLVVRVRGTENYQGERKVDLEPHESVRVRLPLPRGTPGSKLEATVEYPPR